MSTIVKKIESMFAGDDASDPMAKLDGDMKEVLDAFSALHPKPIETLSPKEARQQPTLTNAVHTLMRRKKQDTADDMGVRAIDTTFISTDAILPVRMYRPEGEDKALPIIVYFHGGGWVIADIETYDAGARAMAKQVNAVVVSAHYRQAPEHPFPAAHEDAFAAYLWAMDNAASFGGDARRMAIMGESAGGNLAVATAIRLRDHGVPMPKHIAAIYPVAGVDMDTASYRENAFAKPLNKAMMGWFMEHVLAHEEDKHDARLDLIGHADVSDLPPVTIVTAGIDPLRSDGELLAAKLEEAGVKVHLENYEGATHEFFGMGTVVSAAKKAEALVADDLKNALS